MSPSLSGGKSVLQLQTELVACGLAYETTTRCAHCGDVVFTGRADDGHQAFLKHLRTKHPRVRVRRRKRNKSWIEAAAAARVRERAAKEAA